MQTLLGKKDINSEELYQLLKAREEGKVDFVLIDVREQVEYDMGYIKGVDILKPTSTFKQWGESVFKQTENKTVIFTCRTGNRSGQVTSVFAQSGHKNSLNHSGGIVTFRGETAR
jgi:rhodanese-related sulfurtransferase